MTDDFENITDEQYDAIEVAQIEGVERDRPRRLTIYTVTLRGHIFKLAITDELHFQTGEVQVKPKS